MTMDQVAVPSEHDVVEAGHDAPATGMGVSNTKLAMWLFLSSDCLFFGAFTIKMLILPKRDLPGWVLPVAGAVVFTVLVVIWLTSAYWFFSTFGIKR